ncbi:iron-sulfur cluster repair di-iron protein [Bacillus sp. 31A1R]|uniref:Iron-sulfur cluster repair di-iron protein n=1 Tax=Robertmurraya mangrovi TaxID=3098077 RepID=A0ABU5IT46_9BACI|nr:iron-sulfur cluster repair di-iron protein [Bacillus sp. 31A1R]MDZ5470313.1 iron-sulfur cluster repair di-iron protein [Bacillus sp. 31A1R]
MNFPFTVESKVKDIVNEMPKAADLFKKYRIDFCCGGNIPLEQAASEKSVDLKQLMEELKQVFIDNEGMEEDLSVWTESASDKIIDHIKDHYHRPLEEELTNLSPYVTKVSRVHGEHRPELLRVYELFYELKRELLEHTAKEEEIVFPLLQQLEDPNVENKEQIIQQIEELEKEHDHAGAILKELREITSDFTPPLDACGTYRLVYKRLELLEGETFMHVHLENNILFPRYIEA